jgi:hypothetical protein
MQFHTTVNMRLYEFTDKQEIKAISADGGKGQLLNW